MKPTLRYIFTMMITVPLVVFFAGCSIHMKPVPIQYGVETASEEKLVLIKNNSGASVLWKKYIGTPFYRISVPYYMIGGSPALFPDDRIFYQNQNYIYALDSNTGEVESTYTKPGRLESSQVDFEHACYAQDKLVVVLEHFLGDREYLIFSDKVDDIQFHSPAYKRGTSFCESNKIISIADDAWVSGVVIREAETSRELWKVRRYFSEVEAIAFDQGATFLALRKGTRLDLRAYESDYYSDRFFGYDTGRLHWEQTIEVSKDAECSLHKLDQLILSELSFGRTAQDLSGQIISFDPVTGHINWRLKDAVILLARYFANDGLVYALQTKLPGVISVIDQKTGEEKLRFSMNNFNYLYGVIVTADQLIFAGTAESNNNPFVDYLAGLQTYFQVGSQSKALFLSVDKKTGQLLWQSEFANLKQLLNYSGGILYFGGIVDNYYKMFFSGGKKMKETNFGSSPYRVGENMTIKS